MAGPPPSEKKSLQTGGSNDENSIQELPPIFFAHAATVLWRAIREGAKSIHFVGYGYQMLDGTGFIPEINSETEKIDPTKPDLEEPES